MTMRERLRNHLDSYFAEKAASAQRARYAESMKKQHEAVAKHGLDDLRRRMDNLKSWPVDVEVRYT